MDVREDRGAELADGAAERIGGRNDTEVRMRGDEGGDGALVLGAGERAGGVDEAAAGTDMAGVLREDSELALVLGAEVGGGGLPTEVRRASPSSGAAARGVDEDGVVERAGGGRPRECGDVGQAGAGGTGAQFGERGGADVGGVDVARRTEKSGELEGLAAGAGAGVEPAGAGEGRGEGEDELRAEILHLERARVVERAAGDIDLDEEGAGVGQERVTAERDAFPLEPGVDGGRIGSLETEPERGAGEQGVAGGAGEGGGLGGEPIGKEPVDGQRLAEPGGNERGLFGGRGGKRGPAGEKFRAEAGEGGFIAGEPEGEIRLQGCGRGLDPREVADGGVGEGAVDAAVAGAETFVAAKPVLEVGGEVGLATGGGGEAAEEFAEDGELAMRTARAGGGMELVGCGHGW